jgi:cytochrome c oxidase cbb3-type subunit III
MTIGSAARPRDQRFIIPPGILLVFPACQTIHFTLLINSQGLRCPLRLAIALLSLAIWVTALPAQEGSTINRPNSSEDIAAGSRIFQSHCLGCHGRSGTGGRGPDLTRVDLRYGNTDQELAGVIGEGIPGTEMPFFFFNGRQLQQIVAFVQSLRQSSPVQVKGNAEKGVVLFRGQGGCLKCHQVNGEGGRLGPDLSQVGARRSPDHLKTSLLQPNQYVSPADRTVHLVTRDGKRLSGIRLNEDTYSLQLLDSEGNLVSVMKSDITEYQLDSNSSMPSYKAAFSESELEDLVAYLYSLRRKEARP